MIEGLDKDIRHLIDLVKEDKYDIREANDVISKNILSIVHKLHIGLLSSNILIPYIKPPKIQTFCIYECPDGYAEERAYTYNFFIGNFTKDTPSSVICCPEKNHDWTDEEQEYIKYLIQLIILVCAKAHLSGQVRIAYERDVTTGIPNLAGLLRYINDLNSREDRIEYTCMYSNIKNFKVVNSSYGSKKADEILISYSLALKEFVKNGIVARLGGDNFFTIIHNDDVDAYISFLNSLEVPVTINDNNDVKICPLRTRAGILPINENLAPNIFIHYAAAACEYARNEGTEDFCWFTPNILNLAVQRKEISTTFPTALLNKEFVVYYQPKIDLNDLTLCGGEALVRWQKDGQIIPPMNFIPVLEKEGTICDLDFYVLEAVCKQLRLWVDSGYQVVPISVNFSKMHLQNTSLADDVLNIINKYNIDHQLIEIEVTELSDYENYSALAKFINCMNDNNINISVDDFGTGFSSINLLKNTSIGTVKLDKSMLDELFSENTNAAIIVRNVINMANELGLEIIAEGVENEQHVEFLKNAHCHIAQGFLFDKPMPSDSFEYRIKNPKY